jgi:hypothetical protein
MSFLDSFLNPYPKTPAFIDGMRISVMKSTILLIFHSIRSKHRMPLWQLDPTFLHEEIEELIRLGYIKIIGSFSLLDPPLIYC